MMYAITGANGFLGKHFAAALLQRGDRAVLIGRPDTLLEPRKYLSELNTLGYDLNKECEKNIDFRPCDLSSSFRSEELLAGCDTVIHLAVVYPRSVNYDSERIIAENVKMTKNLLCSDKLFVFASSYLVYLPQPEEIRMSEHSPIRKDGEAYVESKLVGEKLVSSMPRHLICRFSNTYGPGQTRGFLVPDMICKMRDAKDTIDLMDPSKVRDFLFVKDAVSGVLMLMERKCRGVYNLGSGEGHCIKEVCDCIKKQLNKNFLKYDTVKHEKNFLVQDIKKISKIGWSPKMSLMEGIESTLKYFPDLR